MVTQALGAFAGGLAKGVESGSTLANQALQRKAIESDMEAAEADRNRQNQARAYNMAAARVRAGDVEGAAQLLTEAGSTHPNGTMDVYTPGKEAGTLARASLDPDTEEPLYGLNRITPEQLESIARVTAMSPEGYAQFQMKEAEFAETQQKNKQDYELANLQLAESRRATNLTAGLRRVELNLKETEFRQGVYESARDSANAMRQHKDLLYLREESNKIQRDMYESQSNYNRERLDLAKRKSQMEESLFEREWDLLDEKYAAETKEINTRIAQSEALTNQYAAQTRLVNAQADALENPPPVPDIPPEESRKAYREQNRELAKIFDADYMFGLQSIDPDTNLAQAETNYPAQFRKLTSDILKGDYLAGAAGTSSVPANVAQSYAALALTYPQYVELIPATRTTPAQLKFSGGETFTIPLDTAREFETFKKQIEAQAAQRN